MRCPIQNTEFHAFSIHFQKLETNSFNCPSFTSLTRNDEKFRVFRFLFSLQATVRPQIRSSKKGAYSKEKMKMNSLVEIFLNKSSVFTT